MEQVAAPAPELTLRAVATGMVLGALFAPCNIYTGLKIGWSFNMSIAAGLVGFGLWRLSARTLGTPGWGLRENNINQTAASAAAAISSSGLVAPIPALTMLTGTVLPWHLLSFWVFAVSALGVVVASGLRNQMLLRERLPFPAGVATAETMKQIHGHGSEGVGRLRVLGTAALLSGAIKLVGEIAGGLPRLAPVFTLARGPAGPLTPANLGFALDPSLLMIGFGAIIGLRAGVSLLLGAILAWGVLGPWALERGWAEPGRADPDAAWFQTLVEWLLWPGVTLMVVAALVSFGLSLAHLYVRRRRGAGTRSAPTLPQPVFLGALVAVVALVAVAETTLFGVGLWQTVLAALLSFVLAVVAARVSGETGITPIGAMGKITQLIYGVVTPGNVTGNLMSANITGGAAGQCADMLHDLKTGHIIGATPAFQIVAQVFGVLAGSLVGSLTYLILIPDPLGQLITPEWPAPAVATWKAVAEVLAQGLGSLPSGAASAMAVAAALGVAFALAERGLPPSAARFVPSAPALGLAFVIPAWNSLSMFVGALGAAIIARLAPRWAEDRLMVLAAGLVAGESLVGVGAAFSRILG
jgi:putative OPT family oligopeptide transporter